MSPSNSEKHMIACPACSGEEWVKRYKIGRWDIEECPSCGFARIDPIPDRESRPDCYSQESILNRNLRRKSLIRQFSMLMKRFFSKAGRGSKIEIFYNKLCKYLPSRAEILDIGCGDGSFLMLAKDNFICTGIDISKHQTSLAQREHNIKIITGDFINIDFSGEKYDGMVLISLLEHLDDPAQAVKKCFELLKKGGVLLLKTVNYGCVNRRLRKERWSGFRPPDHIVYFNPSNIKILLRKAGFTKIKISSTPFSDSMYCDIWK